MSRGHIIAGTNIAVNLWKDPENRPIELFFLTHFHQKYIEGLSPSWTKKIYTSNMTAQILKSKLPFLSSCVEPLSFGTSHVLPLESSDYCVVVTLINSAHCPGSISLLFEGTFGTILYTGDFRYHPDFVPQLELHKHVIDLLYFDNTYCSPHCIFPERAVVLEEVVKHVKEHVDKARILIGVDSLGKEEILLRIYQETRRTFTVTGSRSKTLEILDLGFLRKTGNSLEHGALVLVDCREVTGKNVRKWQSEVPTQVVLLTAKFVGAQMRPFKKHKNVRVFPYSGHSSFEDLVHFVKEVKPRKVCPIIEERVEGMYDKNQGSIQSVINLVSCAKAQLDVNQAFILECFLSKQLEDSEEVMNELADFYPFSDEFQKRANFLTAGQNCLSSSSSGTTNFKEMNSVISDSANYTSLKDKLARQYVEHMNKADGTGTARFLTIRALPSFPDYLEDFFIRRNDFRGQLEVPSKAPGTTPVNCGKVQTNGLAGKSKLNGTGASEKHFSSLQNCFPVINIETSEDPDNDVEDSQSRRSKGSRKASGQPPVNCSQAQQNGLVGKSKKLNGTNSSENCFLTHHNCFPVVSNDASEDPDNDIDDSHLRTPSLQVGTIDLESLAHEAFPTHTHQNSNNNLPAFVLRLIRRSQKKQLKQQEKSNGVLRDTEEQSFLRQNIDVYYAPKNGPTKKICISNKELNL